MGRCPDVGFGLRVSYTPPFVIVRKSSAFPNAFTRTFAPRVLQVVHVTGNRDVAALPDGVTAGHSPYQDWLYAGRNQDSADGPSANDYVGRKGSTIEMWDPATHVAWSNGDVKSPNLKLPGVKYLADLRAKGTNANKGCYREIEFSGYPGAFDPTDEQIEVAAYFAATDSITTGLDIIRGETMLTHGDINTIDRQNCAFRPAIREARMADICHRALEIKALLTEGDMGLHITYAPTGPLTGSLVIPPKTKALRVADGTEYTTTNTTPTERSATTALIVGGSGGYLVELHDDELHFIYNGWLPDDPFTPATRPADPLELEGAKAAEHEAVRTAAIKAAEAL